MGEEIEGKDCNMAKPFDYSKWDNIELSDDEEDCHPNIDKESWFRMKHRSRVEREDNEEKDKKRIRGEMEKHNQRIKVIEHQLDKLVVKDVTNDNDDSDDDDDDLDDREGLEAELDELKKQNSVHQAKLDEYEKNKKWNVDNMCHVAEERTIINSNAAKTNYTQTGYAKPKEDLKKTSETVKKAEPTRKAEPAKKKAESKPKPKPKSKPAGPKETNPSSGAMDTYHEFTMKYADTVEEFMHIQSMDRSKEFLLKHGDVLLQENASNYLLLASLEDEMNGYRDKMKLTARQSQIISNIAELAKSMGTHPGNVVIPFFQRLDQKQFYDGFMDGTDKFVQNIIRRAVTKKAEIDRERVAQEQSVDLDQVPREERLGPGGLDPLEVIETLPKSMVDAFESRDIEELKKALMALPPEEAERHMKRCVDSGLWVANAE